MRQIQRQSSHHVLLCSEKKKKKKKNQQKKKSLKREYISHFDIIDLLPIQRTIKNLVRKLLQQRALSRACNRTEKKRVREC
jgi:hypothetical protein